MPGPAELEERVANLERSLEECIRARQSLQEREERYRRITEAVTDYIYTVRVENGQPRETTHGTACRAVTGYTAEEFHRDPYLWIRMVPQEDHPIILEQIAQILALKNPGPIEHRIVRKDDALRWVRNTPVPAYDHHGNLIAYDGLIRDITDIKLEQTKREDLVRELQAALTKVKQLSGLLPICSACKKIRNDQGYWQQIEAFVRDHSDAEFSHGICPDCFKTLYPDYTPNKT